MIHDIISLQLQDNGDRVVLVNSLVPGGAAERDGRLQKRDKLISVNGVLVVNHTLEFTVDKLKSVNLVRERYRQRDRQTERDREREYYNHYG